MTWSPGTYTYPSQFVSVFAGLCTGATTEACRGPASRSKEPPARQVELRGGAARSAVPRVRQSTPASGLAPAHLQQQGREPLLPLLERCILCQRNHQIHSLLGVSRLREDLRRDITRRRRRRRSSAGAETERAAARGQRLARKGGETVGALTRTRSTEEYGTRRVEPLATKTMASGRNACAGERMAESQGVEGGLATDGGKSVASSRAGAGSPRAMSKRPRGVRHWRFGMVHVAADTSCGWSVALVSGAFGDPSGPGFTWLEADSARYGQPQRIVRAHQHLGWRRCGLGGGCGALIQSSLQLLGERLHCAKNDDESVTRRDSCRSQSQGCRQRAELRGPCCVFSESFHERSEARTACHCRLKLRERLLARHPDSVA